MKRVLKVLVPLVILAEAIFVWLGVVDLGNAVLVVAGLEALLFLLGLGGLVLVVRRYGNERRAGLDPWMALEDGLSLVLPRTVARLAVKEPRLFFCLFRWAFRMVRPTNDEFAYHKRSLLRAIMPLLAVSAPVELAVVHVLALAFSPWWWLKWVLLVLGVYATLWLLGLYASLVALPHRCEEKGVRLRYGLLAEGFIPYADILDMVGTPRKAPHPGDGLSCVPEEDALYLATGGKTDAALRLRAPRSLRGFLKETGPASRIHLAVEEPDRLVRELRRRIETPVLGSGIEHPVAAKEAPIEG
jgi:hypothetical protein